jgi:hypothetical protein
MKKASISFNMVNWIIHLIFLVIVTGVFIALATSFVSYKIDTLGTETDLFVEKILNHKEGIAYFDTATDRVYPHIIDTQKFDTKKATEAQLKKIIFYDDIDKPTNQRLAARIVLIQNNKRQELIYNDKKLQSYETFAKTKTLRFSSRPIAKVKRRYTLNSIDWNEKITLEVTVFKPKVIS